MTKPQKNIAYREKTERIFAIVFLILVPISLLTNSITIKNGHHLKIGFTLPLVFILLAADKFFDDLSRLSLLKNKMIPVEQHFKNYSLSEREKEIAKLLVDGKTYKQISEDLFISLPTVKTHASNIYKKCGVKSRHQLTTLMMN
jgi:DNA-binding CsgD family transcriptional regulator